MRQLLAAGWLPDLTDLQGRKTLKQIIPHYNIIMLYYYYTVKTFNGPQLIDYYNVASFSLYRRRRPHRRRRRKFQRPENNISDEIYSSSNYYRRAREPETSSSSAWYNGDYQEEFSDTYKYQGTHEETYSDYKDAYSWDSKHYDY